MNTFGHTPEIIRYILDSAKRLYSKIINLFTFTNKQSVKVALSFPIDKFHKLLF